MASSKQLRENKEQHKAKNTESKHDDKEIHFAMQDCIEYLKDLSYKEMVEAIKACGLRYEFDNIFQNRKIIPDGGIIWLKDNNNIEIPRLVLISEVKHQGTNKKREEEGKKRQAQGNAIERLGKNLAGIRAMMNHEQITPFVCFGWGCDFRENYENDFVMAKVSMMNEFYKLNKLYVYKRDGDSNKNHYAPVSMFFREERWTREEMFSILKEIGEDALRYYLH